MFNFIEKFNINHRIILAYLSFIAAVIFAGIGIFTPPPGILDGSILILCAQLFVLLATLLGLNLKVDLQRKYFHAHNESEGRKDVRQIQEMVDKQYGQIDENDENEDIEENIDG